MLILPYREAYFHHNTHHWPQKEYAYKSFRHTKPLSDPLNRRPWEEATRTPVCPCLTLRCICTRKQGKHPTPQQDCQFAVRPFLFVFGLSWWRTSQNNSKNFHRIVFGQKIKKCSIATFFLVVMWPLWPQPQYPSGRVLAFLDNLTSSFFRSFFLRFSRPKPITVLCGCWTPD